MRDETKALLRLLPSVEELLQHPRAIALLASYPHSVVADTVRGVLSAVRAEILQEEASSAGAMVEPDALVALLETAIAEAERPHLRRVINATGVVVHTNLGRSVLAAQAVAEAMDVASHYSTLEYRLESGERGSRHEHVEGLLCGLTGAEAAMVVNNNAAAVLLVLLALAQQGEVLVSRGQLVEIGGSFRIPDIMHLSGARLVEVGTTNKTRIEDYEAAITPETSLLLRVHTSNFKIVGFTEEAPLEQLVALGRKYRIPVADDLGSGALARLHLFREEPDVRVSLATGVDLATFSGDKLLGGPQAGVILGRSDLVAVLKRHPLARVVRVDKMTLAALEATLRLYRDPERAVRDIPTLAYLSRSSADTEGLALELQRLVQVRLARGAAFELAVEPTRAKVGGGALPLLELPSYALVVRVRPGAHPRLVDLERRLRLAEPPLLPVVARIEREALVLDVIAVAEDELAPLAESLAGALAGVPATPEPPSAPAKQDE